MDSEKFLKAAKELVAGYLVRKARAMPEGQNVEDFVLGPEAYATADDVYVVWNCFILGNNKAMLSTPFPNGLYFEVTGDNLRDNIYFDVYRKELNMAYKADKLIK